MRWRTGFAAVALIAVATAAGATAGAAVGEPWLLGGFNTAERNKTTLWANSNGFALRVKQVRDGQPALRLENDGAAAPLFVNSGGWVERLNVDEVDGYDAADLTRAVFCAVENAPDGEDLSCTAVLDAPVPGVLLVGGSAEMWRNVGWRDDVTCRITVDGVPVAGTVRDVVLDGTGYEEPPPAAAEANCGTDGGTVVTAGGHDVAFEVIGVEVGTGFVGAGMWAVFTPFDGAGVPVP